MRSRPRLRAPGLSSAARWTCDALRPATSSMRRVSSSQRWTCSVLRRSEALDPFVPLLVRDVSVVGVVVALEGMVVVVALDGVTALVALTGVVAVVALAGVVAVVALARVGTPARLGMPAELSGLSLPFVPAALPVVGHAGSTGCVLDVVMDARACADEANTISAATPATVILFIVQPRMDDVPA